MHEPNSRLIISGCSRLSLSPESRQADRESGQRMRKALTFLGATVGSYAGWYIGSPIGFMTAFVLSMIGTGLGIYAGIRVARNYE